nr:hypothetical protein BaRGS_023139 [Batillaria attramentaria]
MVSPGLHAILVVLRRDMKFTKEEADCVQLMRDNFGSDIMGRVIIVFTHCDMIDKEDEPDEFLRDCPEDLREYIRDLFRAGLESEDRLAGILQEIFDTHEAEQKKSEAVLTVTKKALSDLENKLSMELLEKEKMEVEKAQLAEDYAQLEEKAAQLEKKGKAAARKGGHA